MSQLLDAGAQEALQIWVKQLLLVAQCWKPKLELKWLQRLKSEYAMQEAIESFGRLPPMQYATGWVLSCIGRAYFEMVDYHQAAQAFQYARKADPSRLEVSSYCCHYTCLDIAC